MAAGDQGTVFPRDEIEAAWTEFKRRGVGSHDWEGWADLFTDDAVYIEHNLGTFNGRQGIKDFIIPCMAAYGAMSLAIEWSVIEGNRICFFIWNLLPDPAGEGRTFAFPNTTLLDYAGDGKFSFEEDFYNPADATRVFTAWMEAGGRRTTPCDLGLGAPTDWAPQPSSTPHPRDEVEREFHAYVQRGATAFETGDWDTWARQFTPDARYREHHYGAFDGRQEIRDWITGVMQPFPGMDFPVEWYGIDGNRVAMLCQNRLPDPKGGDAVFEFPTNVILHYAGDGQWSYEEDVYNPADGERAIAAWLAAGGRLPT